jgi:hypothetical protein
MLSEYEPTCKKNIFDPKGQNQDCVFIAKLRARIQSLNKDTTFDMKNVLNSGK